MMEVVKKHPLAIGAGAVVLLLLFMRSGGGASGGSTDAAQLQAQKTASATDIAINGQNAQASAARASVMGALWAKSIDANASIAVAQNTDMVQLLLGSLGMAATMRQHDQQAAIAQSQIDASTSIAAQTLNDTLQAHAMDANVQLTKIADAFSLDQLSIKTTADNLPALIDYRLKAQTLDNGNAQTLATINGNTAAVVASINGVTAQAVAATNTAAARKTADANATNSTLSNVADIVGTFLAL